MKKILKFTSIPFFLVLALGFVALRFSIVHAATSSDADSDSDSDSAVELQLQQVQQLQSTVGQLVGESVAMKGTTANVSTQSAVSQNPTVINSCGSITQPGNYVLGSNLDAPAGLNQSCINIYDTQNVQFNCDNFSISQGPTGQAVDIVVASTTNYSIENCQLLGPQNNGAFLLDVTTSSFGTIENNTSPLTNIGLYVAGDNITIASNTFDGDLSVAGNNETIENNMSDFTGTGALETDNLLLSDSNNSLITNNTLIGGWNGIPITSISTAVGADDGINTDNVTNITISSNTIMNDWDAGIEPAGIFNYTTVSNNNITNVDTVGIGEWYGMSMQGDVISGNAVSKSERLFMFDRLLNLAPSEQYVYFLNNTFTNNSAINSIPGSGDEVNVVSDGAIPADLFVTGNDVFTKNGFGGTIAPEFGPNSMFIDGGGNSCASSGAAGPLPLDCSGTSVAPSVPSLNAATASSPTQVNLSWTGTASRSAPVVGYLILRNGSILASVSSSASSYADATAMPGTVYSYAIRSFSAANIYSALSNAITVTTPGASGNPSVPTISSFSATPTSITAGQPATLSWSTTGATSLSISGIGAVSGNSVSVSPSVTTTYTLTATNAAGSVTANVTVTVNTTSPSLPVISSFSASPSSITTGQSATLSWSTTGATSVSITGIGTVTGSSASVSPSVTTTYTLTATNAAGSATSSATVTVSAASVPTVTIISPTPGQTISGTVTISASISGYLPDANGLSASFDGATGRGSGFPMTLSGGIYSVSVSTASLAAGTHTVTVKGNDTAGNPHSATESVTVGSGTQTPAPTISSFSASPSSITAGQPATLSWSTTGATSLSISGIGAVSGNSVSVSPSVTTTYTLTATNAAGSVTATATVTVMPSSSPSPIITIVNPMQGQSVSGVANISATTNFTPSSGSLTGSLGAGTRNFYLPLSGTNTYATTYSTASLADGSYTLVISGYDASGAFHSASEAFVVNNNGTQPSLPTISSFSASPSSITAGQPATLSWSTTGATSLSISGIGAVSGNSVSVSPSVTTTYTLTATNAAGSVTATATVTVSGVVDTTPPSAPSLTSATASGPTQVNLSWTASTDNVGVVGYQITRNGSILASVPASSLTYANTTVAPNTTYTYSVKAYDAAGNYSAASNAIMVTTPPTSLSNITIISPTPGQVVSGVFYVSVAVPFTTGPGGVVATIDNVGVSYLAYDGQYYSGGYSTARLSNGLHTIVISTTDLSGHSYSATASFTVSN